MLQSGVCRWRVPKSQQVAEAVLLESVSIEPEVSVEELQRLETCKGLASGLQHLFLLLGDTPSKFSFDDARHLLSESLIGGLQLWRYRR